MSIKSIITVCAWILATNIQAQPVATGSGTENDPYNVQAAIDYVKSLGTNVPSENNVYVKGYVVELRSFPLVSGEATFIIRPLDPFSGSCLTHQMKYVPADASKKRESLA